MTAPEIERAEEWMGQLNRNTLEGPWSTAVVRDLIALAKSQAAELQRADKRTFEDNAAVIEHWNRADKAEAELAALRSANITIPHGKDLCAQIGHKWAAFGDRRKKCDRCKLSKQRNLPKER